jgi:hypothetical protein
MVKKREARRAEGKETIFRRRRRPDGPLQTVSDQKVDRIADRYAHDLTTWPDDARKFLIQRMFDSSQLTYVLQQLPKTSNTAAHISVRTREPS